MRRAEETFAREFRNHRLSNAPSRSWKMRRPDTWNLGFYVTWSPGVLTLTGDLGDLTVSHPHALANPWSGIFWIARADFDYLMTKTDAEKEFDPETTAREIVAMVAADDRDAALSFKEHRLELAAEIALERARRIGDDHAGAPSARDLREARDRLTREREHAAGRRSPELHGPGIRYLGWEQIAEAIDAFPEDVYTSEGRAEIRHTLESCLENAHEAADLCCRLEIDDYYGSYRWPTLRRMQHAALKAWAESMIAQEPTWHRAWRALQDRWANLREAAREIRKGRWHVAPTIYRGDLHGPKDAPYVLRETESGLVVCARVTRTKVPFVWREAGGSATFRPDHPDLARLAPATAG